MLGIFRYLLAIMVVFAHLWSEWLWWQGPYAVFCFYVVSGYLMSLILNETYVGERAWLRYLENRALRIFPVYWLVLALTLAFSHGFPELQDTPIRAGIQLHHVLRQADGYHSWLANITLIVPAASTGFAISQAWSLHVELVFYIAMLFLARSRTRVIIWSIISLGLVVWQHLDQLSFAERYTGILGSSLAFSVGSLVYHYKDRLNLQSAHLPVSMTLFLFHTFAAAELWGFPRDGDFSLLLYPHHYGLYANTLLGAYVLVAVISHKKVSIVERVGKLLGNLAYPVFLLHWLVAGVLIGSGISYQNKPALLPLAFLLINLLALALNRWLERPVERLLRSKIRNSATNRVESRFSIENTSGIFVDRWPLLPPVKPV